MHTNNFNGWHTLDDVERLLQDLFDVAPVIRHTGHPEHRFLPEVLPVNFGNREVKLAAQAILHAMQDLPLILERLTLRNPQLEKELRKGWTLSQNSLLGVAPGNPTTGTLQPKS